MASLILSTEAAADLEEIVEFIASENVDAAVRVLAEIREALECVRLGGVPLFALRHGRRIWIMKGPSAVMKGSSGS